MFQNVAILLGNKAAPLLDPVCITPEDYSNSIISKIDGAAL